MSAAVEHAEPPASGVGPLVPRAELLALVRERYPGRALGELFAAHGINADLAYNGGSRGRRWYSFEVADRIVTRVLDDAGLWERVPFLARAYSQLGE